jgi:general secretion pathway protein D
MAVSSVVAPLADAQTNAVPQPPAAPAGVRRTPQPITGAPTPSKAPANGAGRSINFQNAPLSAVLQYYADMTKRSIIQAPNLAGTITFVSQVSLTDDEAIQALESVLAINGIGLVPVGEKFLTVTQIATAKPEGLPVEVGEGARTEPRTYALVTRVVPLKYADATEMVAALQPYLHAYGQLLPLAKSNSILITDTGWTIQQMLKIVDYVDQPSPLRMETRFYTLQNAKSADVVQRLMSIVQETQNLSGRSSATAPGMPTPGTIAVGGGMRPSASRPGGAAESDSLLEGKVIITPDERTNKIIILSRASNFEFFEKLIAELDTRVEPEVATKVVQLQYATADEAALLINALIGTSSGVSFNRTQGRGGVAGRGRTDSPLVPTAPMGAVGGGQVTDIAGFLQFAQGVRILPDMRTNTLLLMATKGDLERLEAMIKEIDTPVAQVLIEVVIAEVALDDNLEVGVNWVRRVVQPANGVYTYGGQTVATDSNGNALPAPVDMTGAAIGSTPTGAAISSALTYFATFKGMKLDVAIRLLSASSRFKVLSTPIIQTLDNQEANIIVGESRPVPTSTLSDVYGGSAAGTNQVSTGLRANVEYKDVAIELKVTPRINPDGYVTMDIDQKVNDLGGNVNIGGIEAPSITKREARSFVTAKDQSTIVLGGLIKESKTITATKVPVLGDLPFVGNLFRSKKDMKSRKELIVFIRPTVLRSSADALAEARYRAKMMKGGHMELELEKQFLSKGQSTNDVPFEVVPFNTNSPAIPAPSVLQGPQTTTSPAPPPTASQAPSSREVYSEKMRALREQVSPPQDEPYRRW